MRFTPQEVRTCFKKARRVLTHPGFDILIAPAAYNQGRILVVTARRVGNSPERNKIRRQFKAIFHEEKLFELPFDCIIITKPGAQEIPFTDKKEILISTLRSNAQ